MCSSDLRWSPKSGRFCSDRLRWESVSGKCPAIRRSTCANASDIERCTMSLKKMLGNLAACHRRLRLDSWGQVDVCRRMTHLPASCRGERLGVTQSRASRLCRVERVTVTRSVSETKPIGRTPRNPFVPDSGRKHRRRQHAACWRFRLRPVRQS